MGKEQVWCPEHKQYESADDPYDFPISNTFRNAFIDLQQIPDYGLVDLSPPPLVLSDEQESFPIPKEPPKRKAEWRATPKLEPNKPEPSILETYGKPNHRNQATLRGRH